jgi:hypothetical protein
MNESVTPTMVVMTIIVQKTLPMPDHMASPPSLQGTVKVYELDAEHAEDEEHHEQAEAEGAHKLGNRASGVSTSTADGRTYCREDRRVRTTNGL